jgi:hypothetical protein
MKYKEGIFIRLGLLANNSLHQQGTDECNFLIKHRGTLTLPFIRTVGKYTGKNFFIVPPPPPSVARQSRGGGGSEEGPCNY